MLICTWRLVTLHGHFIWIQIATEQQATSWNLWVKVVSLRSSLESRSHYLNIVHNSSNPKSVCKHAAVAPCRCLSPTIKQATQTGLIRFEPNSAGQRGLWPRVLPKARAQQPTFLFFCFISFGQVCRSKNKLLLLSSVTTPRGSLCERKPFVGLASLRHQ